MHSIYIERIKKRLTESKKSNVAPFQNKYRLYGKNNYSTHMISYDRVCSCKYYRVQPSVFNQLLSFPSRGRSSNYYSVQAEWVQSIIIAFKPSVLKKVL